MRISFDLAKILIIDDDPRYIKSLKEIFHEQYEILSSLDSANASEIAASKKPLLILLDLMMSEIDGYHVIKEIKRNSDTADIPVIVVTGLHDSVNETMCLRMGAVDYITKPFNPEIVKARVHTHVQLKRQNDLLKVLSYQDGLTGIANRRYFDETLDREYRRCQRSHSPLSLLMIDVDYFKAYNDIYGHLAGDDCLKLIALSMIEQINRSSDLLARYGGEEFTCILPETDQEGAQILAENLRAAVLNMKIPHNGGVNDQVTISIGVAMDYPHKGNGTSSLLSAADRCLYKAKVNGRNAICIAPC